ncbi:hypothetical protein SLPG_00020 [Salicola phage CGphi29]|uniref:hypothetical protein n=1 Tax=Salicola phage CGphi29 TaxID=754067 RepID=UPI0002C14054|nr:hypothetical protein SLPG_00020 [Salicola phage CGphi29]AGH31814.1 hypothetical protein SLPG_00020 [Salicola phage CGphi29]
MPKHPETMLVERNGQTVRINKADFDPKRETDPNEKPKRSPGRPKRKTEDSEQWQNSTAQ